MKRQKRDRLERAHQRGYQAGIAGRSKEMFLSDAESKVTMAGRLARSHGGQGSNGLILSL